MYLHIQYCITSYKEASAKVLDPLVIMQKK